MVCQLQQICSLLPPISLFNYVVLPSSQIKMRFKCHPKLPFICGWCSQCLMAGRALPHGQTRLVLQHVKVSHEPIISRAYYSFKSKSKSKLLTLARMRAEGYCSRCVCVCVCVCVSRQDRIFSVTVDAAFFKVGE